jgi:NAD(P)-dependent dehydrogenase (short-subunit alcohol dehydrogenase family)
MSDSPVAIITGAGTGIGRATAIMLGKRGYGLGLVGRRADRLEQVATEIGEDRCLVMPADITKASLAEQIITRTHRQFGRLDVLVNNAGFAPLLPIDQTTPAIIDEVYRVNALAPAYLIHFAWPIFFAQNRGCIVNVSTMGTVDPFPGFLAYASAKASVNLMARSCANEGAAHGIRAFVIAPGAVETEMFRGNFPESKVPRSKAMPPEKIAGIILECIEGKRDRDCGKTIEVLSP